MKYVIVPGYLPNFPDIALALADIAVTVLKALSITASQEQRNLFDSGRATETGEVTEKQFADRIADRIETEVRARGPVARGSRRPTEELGDSYLALATYIARERANTSGRPTRPGETETEAGAAPVDRRFFASLIRNGGAPGRGARASGLGEIWAILKWAFGMTHSRCAHVGEYLRTIEARGTYVDRVVNLMVDYDQWLNDGPSNGSGHADQVAFWTRYARHAAPRLKIHNFAGYDPLKHAEERMAGRGSAYFDTLKQWFLAGRGGGEADHAVSGFKLYPPMGFNADRNAGVRLPEERAGLEVNQRWRHNGWDLTRLGAELDAALDEFFPFCAEQEVPLFAHARNGQEAMPGSGMNASPQHWFERAKRIKPEGGTGKPLRLCLGHCDSALEFQIAMPRILDLNYAGRSDIYFDLGYDEEFLNGRGPDLLRLLGRICAEHDPECRYVTFGTDWIMLGQQANADRYLDAARSAAANDVYWRNHLPALFGGNLRRFLRV